MNEISQEVRISNKRGLHARASAKFVTLASGLSADIIVSKDGNHVTGTSIMGLMMLGAAMGDSIIIKAVGPDAIDSLDKLVTLVQDKFGEE
ncbi:HPr family phosphocarrier protein [Sphingobium sp. BYY-5]|uniref:HPr family phosphocarrier protein n=1 Tax=Sphingobium sp. BYY-5 TaxID=2926400 RepID=UPI001FA6B6FA|nr:HPr family phosphocarrier protein [Sphingobium sp. BYY-5]MCI4588576.1 HPr family phosphocarrier protein [Sphingobium sp. BYY-5]